MGGHEAVNGMGGGGGGFHSGTHINLADLLGGFGGFGGGGS